MRVNEQAILIGVSKDCLAKRITTFVLPARYFKSQRRFGDAIDFSCKVPPLIVKKRFAIGEEELHVTYLWSVDRGIVDLGHTTGIECVPDSAGGRIGRTDGNFGAVCPPRLNARATWCATCSALTLHCIA